MPDDLTGLRCPTCEYDLTGLREHRCPECGTEFDAVALRQPPRSRALAFTAYGLFAYASLALIHQVLLRVLDESAWRWLLSPFGMSMVESVHAGLMLSILGGLVCGAAAVVVALLAAMRNDEVAFWVGQLAALVMLISAFLAFGTISYLA